MDNFKNEIKKIVNKKVNDLKEILINLNDENIEILYTLVKKIFNLDNIESNTRKLQIMYIINKYVNSLNGTSNINNKIIILKLANVFKKIESNNTNKTYYNYIQELLEKNEIYKNNKNKLMELIIYNSL